MCAVLHSMWAEQLVLRWYWMIFACHSGTNLNACSPTGVTEYFYDVALVQNYMINSSLQFGQKPPKDAFLWHLCSICTSPSQVFWCARRLHPFWRVETCVPRDHARYAKWANLWDFKLPRSTQSGHAAGYSNKCGDVEDGGDRVARTEGWLEDMMYLVGLGFQFGSLVDPQMATCESLGWL